MSFIRIFDIRNARKLNTKLCAVFLLIATVLLFKTPILQLVQFQFDGYMKAMQTLVDLQYFGC